MMYTKLSQNIKRYFKNEITTMEIWLIKINEFNYSIHWHSLLFLHVEYLYETAEIITGLS